MVGGPLLGLFTLGVIFRRVEQRGAVVGFIRSVMMVVMTMMTLRKLSFLWSAGAEMSHEGWVQNAHKDRLIYQACVVFTIISRDNIYLRTLRLIP